MLLLANSVVQQNETRKSSLAKAIERIIPFYSYHASLEQLENTLANFESNIEDLEIRVQNLDTEIQVLVAQRQVESNSRFNLS